jgi:hypothetical protein
MIRSKVAMVFLWTALALALHLWSGVVAPVHGQGTRKDDIVFNSRGVPLAGASVRICAMPASGQPCTPLALIYSDAALTQAMANPTTTDGMGNYYFFAAPGKYEVEISGPGITNKQLPNVLLPSDPSSPTFTGGINAFSLTLSGNLTVNGNTTVVGSLASGTLNLTNQATPPGAASAGTVNLYSKTADKKLYYKDDTGAESGPISTGGSGAQTNITNTFTASQNFDADLHYKGPNPYYDLTRFGLYTGSGGAITCSTTGGSTTASCPGGIGDFAVGQGIEIPLAGVAPTFNPWGVTSITNYSRSSNVATYTYTFTTPVLGAGQTVTIAGLADSTFNGTFTVTGNDGDFAHFTVANTGSNLGTTAGTGTATLTSPAVIVTPSGILNGSTTYNYKVVLRGYHGELSVASPAGTTTTGAAAPGVNNATIASCSRTSGLATCTTSAAHNFQNSVPVNVNGTGDNSFNGAFTIASIPTSTTFTYWQNGASDSSGTVTSGTASVVAKNTVQWNMQQYIVLQSIVYRSINGGAYSIVGVGEGMDSAFVDWGLGAPTAPSYVPSTPPGTTTNGIFATTITAINGTNLTLAAAATNTATSQTAQHDNTPIVLAGCAAMPVTGGGTLLIPALNPVGSATFNSPLDFYHSCNVSQLTWELATPIVLNDPVIMKPFGLTIKARPGAQVNGAQFQNFFSTSIFGNGYPLFYFVPGSFGPNTLENLGMNCNHPYQSCVLQDQDAGGGGVASISYNNDIFSGAAGSMPFLMRSSGFNFWFDRGIFQVNGGSWGVPEALTIGVNHGLGITAGQFGQGVASIIEFNKTFFAGTGILYESYGLQPLVATPGHVTFFEPLFESGFTPWLRYNISGNPAVNTTIINVGYADTVGGSATPIIDATNVNGLSTYKVVNGSCGNGNQPLFEGNVSGGVDVSSGYSGCGIIGLPAYILHALGTGGGPNDIYNNGTVSVTGAGGEVFSSMAEPTAPSLGLSAGGSVPLGGHTYTITAVDANGNQTTVSSAASITTTTGNQTVTITPPTLPAGAVGYEVYRDLAKVFYGGASCAAFTAGSAPFVDSTASICGNSGPQSNTAGTTTLTQTGISAPQLKLVGGGFVDTVSGSFTANRTHTLPDVGGIVPVTSYLNSSYDNFNRANGAIGGNWTVTDGSFNVASNAVIGTGAVNLAYWSANPFANTQFAQVAVASLNGTTDFVGVQVLMSPGGNGYTCVENSASLLLQKMTAFSGANLTSSSTAGAVGDILRLEVTAAGVLTCSRNANGTITSITATDTTFTSGSPGMEHFGSVATMDNWSGGNLHPIAQFDAEQDWTKLQHFGQGVAIASEPLSASPRAEQNIFLPGALTSTWTASTWTTDKAVTVTRVQVQAKTAPAGCATNAVVRLTDGTTPVNITISGAANDSGSISQNYAAGAALQLVVQTAAAGCTTSPADANVVVQYRMQ